MPALGRFAERHALHIELPSSIEDVQIGKRYAGILLVSRVDAGNDRGLCLGRIAAFRVTQVRVMDDAANTGLLFHVLLQVSSR